MSYRMELLSLGIAAVGGIVTAYATIYDPVNRNVSLWLNYVGAAIILFAPWFYVQQKYWEEDAGAAHKPIEFIAQTFATDYPKGSSVGGIEWRAGYRDVRVIIANPSDIPYQQIDIVVRPNTAIAVANLLNSTGRTTWNNEPQAHFEYGWSDTGKRLAIPFVVLASEQGVRVRCDTMSPKSTIELVMAAVNIESQELPADKEAAFHAAARDPDYWFKSTGVDNQSVWFAKEGFSDAIFDMPPTVTEIEISGSYQASDQARAVSMTITPTDIIGHAREKLRADSK